MTTIRQIISNINHHCDALNFGEARRMIELNITELQIPRNYCALNNNATVLFKYIMDQQQSNEAPLTRLEQIQISEVNKYCSAFDISMLKRTIKNCLQLLQRPDIDKFLNDDAKTVLSSMGMFIKNEMKQMQ